MRIIKKRTEFSKTFLLKDGSYATYISAIPIHKEDKKGNLKDIENIGSVKCVTDVQSKLSKESKSIQERSVGDGSTNSIIAGDSDLTLSTIGNGISGIASDELRIQQYDENAFSQVYSVGYVKLSNINLPDTVKQIDAYAFANCPNLKNVIAPGVEYCGRYAFYNCPNLKNIEMPLVTTANTAMYKNCSNLTCIDGCEFETVCNRAFANCSSIDLSNLNHDYKVACYQHVYHDTSITISCSKCDNSYIESFSKHIGSNYSPLDLNKDGIVNGRLKEITYANGSWIKYYYDDSHMKYCTKTSANEWTHTEYNDAFLPVSYTDEYGTTTTYTYDNKFQVTQEVVENETTAYTYDGSGHLLTMTVRGGEENSDTTYTYDNNGNVIHEQCDNNHSYFTYDSNKNVLVSATLKEDYEGEIPNAYDSSLTCFDTTVYTYDSSGRVLTETNSNGESSAYVYDSVGNVTQETVTTIENGTSTTTVTNYTYDDLGNLLTSQTGNENSSYTYDAAGRTLLANEGGECTRTLYDNQGRVVQEIGPEDYDSALDGLPNANTYSDSTAGHTYVYDSTTGDLTSETNRLGVQTVYTYWDTGEKKTEEFDIYKFCYNVKGLTTQVYISGTNTVSYNYDNQHDYRLTSTVYANGQSEQYSYDNDGHLKYQYHNNSNTPYLTYSYDEDGNLEEKVNTDTGLRYEYDGNDVEVYKTSNNTLIHSYSEEVTEADEENEVEARTDTTQSNFGTTTTSALVGNSIEYITGNNTLEYHHTDNSDYQITADEINYNNDTAMTNTYTYDNDGNATGKHVYYYDSEEIDDIVVQEYSLNGRIVSMGVGTPCVYYSYDSKGQLSRVNCDYPASCTNQYTYDSRGNITAKNEYVYTTGSLENATPTSTQSFTYANSGWTDKLTAVDNTPLTYDAIGNVLTYGDRSFTWTSGRNLAQITEGTNTYSYTYDENGIRTSKTINGITTQYNTKDGVILAQSDGTNTMTFQYDTAGQPLGFTYNGTQYTYLVSQSGIIMAVMDSTGHFIVGYDYDEWGKLINTYYTDRTLSADQIAAVNANPLRYKGYYYDQETGYYYLQSRYYDPSICRFINEDLPEMAEYTKDQTNVFNLFSYCGNDPVDNFDFCGYCYKKNGKIICENWATAYVGKQSFSDNGIKMLKACESFHSKAYKAMPNEEYYTIGYGHYGPDVKKNQTITKSEATKLLKNDIKLYKNAVNKFTKKYFIRLSTPQFDSLVIDCYQRGQNMWKSDKYDLTKFMKKSHCFIYKWYKYSDVEEAFLGTVTKTGGLPKRRKAEAKLFYKGEYTFKGIYD